MAWDRPSGLTEDWASSGLRPDFSIEYVPRQQQFPGMEVTKVLIVEADGHGHFEQVRNWDLKRARENDERKALLVFSSADSTRREHLVAFHHEALELMTEHDMATILDYVDRTGTQWVFVRPSGCNQMRSYPATTTPVLEPGILDNFEVFVVR